MAGLSNLTYLLLDYNQISDISVLSELLTLDTVFLGNNCISDFSPVSHVPNVNGAGMQEPDTDGDGTCDDVDDDIDGDGIYNEVDTNPLLFSNEFSKERTNGVIIERGDQILVITDIAGRGRVKVEADHSGGATPAIIEACNNRSRISVTAGDSFVIRCSSVILEVLIGTVEVTFIADDGTEAYADLGENNTITFDPAEKTFETPPTNVDTVVVLVEGTKVSVEPGETAVAVEIDIKPGSDPNSINLGVDGVVPVAILTTPDFDASTVDPATVTLEGAYVNSTGKSGKLQATLEDVDYDGDLDLSVKIINELNLTEGDTVAYLEGNTYGGIAIHGQDSVNIVP